MTEYIPGNTPEDIIVARGLYKDYDGLRAVKEIEFTVRRAE